MMKVQAARVLFSFTLFGAALFSYVDRENSLTKARLELFPIAKEIKELEESNAAHSFELAEIYAPHHLLELAMDPEFGHLTAPEDQSIALYVPAEASLQKTIEKPSTPPAPHVAASR